MLHKQFEIKSTRIKCLAFHPHYPVIVCGHHCGSLTVTDTHYRIMCRISDTSCSATSPDSANVGSIRSVKFHPSGKIFATAGDDKVIRVYSYDGLVLLTSLKGHSDYIRSIDFHPTHPYLVSASDDSSIKVFNYNTGQLLSSSVGHHHYVMAVLFLDSTHIVSGSLDHTLILWNCEKLLEVSGSSFNNLSPKLINYQVIDGHDRGVNVLHFSNGKLYSGSDDREIRVYSYINGYLELENAIRSHEGNVTGIFVPNDKPVGVVYGVGEDSLLTINSTDNKTINLNSRAWCIDSYENIFAIGTDDGLLVYKNEFAISTTRSFFSINEAIYSVIDDRTELFMKNKSSRLSLQECDDKLVVNSTNSFEVYKSDDKVVKNKAVITTGSGSATIFKGFLYQYDKDVLTIVSMDGSPHPSHESTIKYPGFDRVESTVDVIYLIGKRSILLLMQNEKTNECDTDNISIFTLFDIKDVVTCMDADGTLNVAVIGEFHINLNSYNAGQTDKGLQVKSRVSDECSSTANTLAIKELLPITSAYFYLDILFYTTIKQLKYTGYNKFQGIGRGIICSVKGCSKIRKICRSGEDSASASPESSSILEFIDEKLERKSLNLDEIVFKKTVIATTSNIHDDSSEEILKCIQKYQLPGLSPIEFLIKSNRGKVALPFIKDIEKRIRLLVSEGEFNQAYEELTNASRSSHAISNLKTLLSFIADNILIRAYDDSELLKVAADCYRKSKEFDKLNFLELFNGEMDGSDNILKSIISENTELFKQHWSHKNEPVIDKGLNKCTKDGVGHEGKFDDASSSITKKLSNMSMEKKSVVDISSDLDDNINHNETSDCIEEGSRLSNLEEFTNDNLNGSTSDGSEESNHSTVYNSKIGNSMSQNCHLQDQDENSSSACEKNVVDSLDICFEDVSELNGNSITSSVPTNISDLVINSTSSVDMRNDSEISDAIDDSSSEEFYKLALNLTTIGKFGKAVEYFRKSININQEKEKRKKIGHYLLGLHIERKRKELSRMEQNGENKSCGLSEIASRIVNMSMFFNSLELEEQHNLLTSKLAMNVNYKYKNYKTALQLASWIVEKDAQDDLVKSAKTIIDKIDKESRKNPEDNLALTDKYPIETLHICYDTLENESDGKECSVCFVSSKNTGRCKACEIGEIME